MRKTQEIKVITYVEKNGELVRFDDLTPEEKQYAATKLKLDYLNAMYRGIAHFYVDDSDGRGDTVTE